MRVPPGGWPLGPARYRRGPGGAGSDPSQPEAAAGPMRERAWVAAAPGPVRGRLKRHSPALDRPRGRLDDRNAVGGAAEGLAPL